MPRPKKCRLITKFPDITIYKPSGVNMIELETVIMNFDELEALRYADYEGKKQVDAAKLMNISRATFGRIIEMARFKVADTILNGKALVIKGGDFCHEDMASSDLELVNNYIEERRKKCLSCPKYLDKKTDNSNQIINKGIVMNSNSYKIAIVSDDGTTVNGHFGSATFYEVFTIENNTITNKEQRRKLNIHGAGLHHLHQHSHHETNEISVNQQHNNSHNHSHSHSHTQGQGHGHGHNHSGMIENILDCEYLLSRGMGYGIYNHLESAGIKPIVTNIRNLEDAVKAVIDGTIENHINKLH